MLSSKCQEKTCFGPKTRDETWYTWKIWRLARSKYVGGKINDDEGTWINVWGWLWVNVST